MGRVKNNREAVLKASRSYYSRRAYYGDFLAQHLHRAAETTNRELDFLEHAFRTAASRPVNDVLDAACGGGRHIVGLAHRGYRCTGQDYTPEHVEIAKARAKREGVSVTLLQGDAARLNYQNEVDAVLALNILFLLPDDENVQRCLSQIHRALRQGGVLVCNIFNPFYTEKGEFSDLLFRGLHVDEARASGIRNTSIDRLQSFDRVHGVMWVQETSVVEAPDGKHVFRDKERVRLLTYWDLLHYLRTAGFTKVECYPDMKIKQSENPKAEELAFVARK